VIVDLFSSRIVERPVSVAGVENMVVRDKNGTPVAVFSHLNQDTVTFAAAGDAKFKEALAAVGFLERVDVIQTSI
jgi:hypothetical protein